MSKCSAVMTKDPVWCLPEDSVGIVARTMKNRDVGSVPIIENEQDMKLVGIVTDRDLALRVVAEGRDVETTKASDVMSRDVVTCRIDDDLQVALDAMSENQLRRIPVVDGNDRMVGIIAQADVATRIDQPETTAAVVKEISQSE